MNDQSGPEVPMDRLDAELALLRERLRDARAPEIGATGLPAALRARQARRAAAATAPAAVAAAAAPPLSTAGTATRRHEPLAAGAVVRRPRAVLAAAAAVAMAAVAALLALRVGPPLAERGARPQATGPRPASTAAAPGDLAAAAFQPLLYAPGFSPTGSYSVVRVRIPLSALTQEPRLEGTIEADLLVGEDGLASGIRFASTDTQIVSAGPR